MKVAIIFNPSSGKGLGEATAAAAQRHLRDHGLETELHPTAGPRHATDLARELAPSIDIIVAVGGDGTINEVVSGMADAAEAPDEAARGGMADAAEAPDEAARGDMADAAEAPDEAARGDMADAAADTGEAAGGDSSDKPPCRLGIVPAGTVNVVALELKLPLRPEDACAVIAAGRTISLDVGKVNNRRFVLMTGAGIDAVTIRNIDPRLKRRLGSLAFVGVGLTKGLAHPHPEFLVAVDGTTYRATFMVASNFHYYAGHLTMTPDADPTDGLLDIMLFGGTTKQSILDFWALVPSRLHVRDSKVTFLRAKRADLTLIEGSGPVWLQADGEIVGELPATVQVEPAAIQVLVP